METKHNIKAWFIDLDGTLLDSWKNGRHWFSETNFNAIQEIKKSGAKVIISTGRLGRNAQPFLDFFRPKIAILASGGQLYVDGKIAIEHKLTLKHNVQILKFVKENKLSIRLNDEYYCYGVNSWILSFLAKRFKYIPIKHFNFPLDKECSKFVIFGKSKKKINLLLKKLKELVTDASIVTSSGGYTIEVTSLQAQKGLAAEFVAKNFLKISREDTAHIGDSMNDSTAINHVGLFVAMADGDKKLLRIAPYIGPSHKRGGVAKILLHGDYKLNRKSILQ